MLDRLQMRLILPHLRPEDLDAPLALRRDPTNETAVRLARLPDHRVPHVGQLEVECRKQLQRLLDFPARAAGIAQGLDDGSDELDGRDEVADREAKTNGHAPDPVYIVLA